MKKATKKNESAKKRLSECGNGVRFTWKNPNKNESLLGYMVVKYNGITFYSCKLLRKKDGSENFVAFPSYEGDDGKYYSYVFVDSEIMEDIVEWANNALYNGGEYWEEES